MTERAKTAPAEQRTISFAEWGEQWMDLVMTSELIEQNLRQVMKSDVQIQLPGINGTGKVQLGEVTRTNQGDGMNEIFFQAPLQIALNLSISVLGLYSETYVASALTNLTLVLRALPMLVLKLECPPLKADDIIAESDGELLVNLLQQVADLDTQLRKYIAAEINQQIAATEEQRTINVLKRIQSAQELLKA